MADREPPYIEMTRGFSPRRLFSHGGTVESVPLHTNHTPGDGEVIIPNYDWQALVTPEALAKFRKRIG